MSDSDKPFACPFTGCNMGFTNEDHLVVHKKKHDMILNFGNGKPGTFIMDETPTPTRFIRNCEEVGLFQDLQNVNPFDETFRRAVESGELGPLPDAEMSTVDDTLHTPHVFPHMNDDEFTSKTISKVSIKIVEENVQIIEDTGFSEETETIVIQEADTSMIPQMITPSPSLDDEEMKSAQETSETICLENNNGSPERDTEDESVEDVPSSHSRAKTRLRQLLTKNKNSIHLKNCEQNENNILRGKTVELEAKKNEESIDVRKKQELLARNRASSMRARAKRKAWVENLEVSMNNVNKANAMLQNEVKALRLEVAQLKTLLLAHKDCPVTKAKKGGYIKVIESPKIIPITQQLVRVDRVPNNVPISPKKKLTAARPKQSILLPKNDKSGSVVTKIAKNPCATLKIVDIGQIASEKKIEKQFIFVENLSPQVSDSRQIIQLDQSLQLINVASKTTRT